MTKSEEINQILHQHIRLVFRDAINYKELIQAFIERDEKQLLLHGVRKSVAKQYAEFCVRCDRDGLPLLEIDDYIKQYCC